MSISCLPRNNPSHRTRPESESWVVAVFSTGFLRDVTSSGTWMLSGLLYGLVVRF